MASITVKYLFCNAVVLIQDFYLNQASIAAEEKKISLFLIQEEAGEQAPFDSFVSMSLSREKTHQVSRYQCRLSEIIIITFAKKSSWLAAETSLSRCAREKCPNMRFAVRWMIAARKNCNLSLTFLRNVCNIR